VSFVLYNPVNFKDPTGHKISCGDTEVGACGGDTPEYRYWSMRQYYVNKNKLLDLDHPPYGNSKPDGSFLSIGYAVSWGIKQEDFRTGSIDLVMTKKDIGLFLSPRENDKTGMMPPQVDVSVTGGKLWGDKLNNLGAIAYEGTFDVVGGSFAPKPIGVTTEAFSSVDEGGNITGEVTGVGNGITFGLGVAPAEAHWYTVNSQPITQPWIPNYEPRWPPRS
jgi:hypothetical protein